MQSFLETLAASEVKDVRPMVKVFKSRIWGNVQNEAEEEKKENVMGDEEDKSAKSSSAMSLQRVTDVKGPEARFIR